MEINEECGDGQVLDNALTLCIENDHTKIASLLLHYGANPNIVLNSEKSIDERKPIRFPLYQAVLQRCNKKTKMLLRYFYYFRKERRLAPFD